MIHSSLKSGGLLLCLLGLCLAMTVSAQAQQRSTGGTGNRSTGGGTGNRGGGGGSGGSSSSSGRQYNNNGTVGDAVISYDPETRRIIVITDEETYPFVSEVVSNLDKPKPQVLIKVVFLEVTYNDGYDIGLDGSFTKKINSNTTLGLTNMFAAGGLSALAPPAGLYQVLGNDFQATIRAIANAGKTEVLSRPSIMARNNQPAAITIGQSVPLITSVRYDTLGNAINSVTYTDVGIILKVTPFITSDGLVEMIVAPEISSVSKTDSTVISAGITSPYIDKRAADTVVVTPNGQTVIIGGLMQNSKSTTDDKIPLLGDIPLLGNLFKRKQKSNAKTELMIFLTPYVVSTKTEVANLSNKEKASSELAPKAFTEKELNQYLDGLPSKKTDDKK